MLCISFFLIIILVIYFFLHIFFWFACLQTNSRPWCFQVGESNGEILDTKNEGEYEEVCIYVPGLLVDTKCFTYISPYFVKHRKRMISCRFRTHEEADHDSRIEDLETLWHSCIKTIRKKVSIYTNSYGSRIAAQWLSMYPKRLKYIDKLVLMHPITNLKRTLEWILIGYQLLPENITTQYFLDQIRIPITIVYSEDDIFLDRDWLTWAEKRRNVKLICLPRDETNYRWQAHFTSHYQEGWLEKIT